MRKALVLCGVVLWLLSGGEVRAERTSTRLTREKPGDSRWTFSVKVEKYRSEGRPDTLGFTVTVTPVAPKGQRLPDRVASLEVRDGKTYISDAPLAEMTSNGISTYTFCVAETYAEKSTFLFGETDKKFEFGQGAYYWFYLADFLPAPEPNPKEKDKAKDPPPAVVGRVAPQKPPISNLDKVLAGLEQELASAISRGDAASLNTILAEDCRLTYPDGTVGDKKSELARAATANPAAGQFAADELKVDIYGGTAVLTGLRSKSNIERQPQVRFTSVYVQRDERWQCVARQLTNAGEPTPKKVDGVLPTKTPFDGDEQKAMDYRVAFAEGYRWASGQHFACPTNPSEHNRHVIRGWVEGWQAGVKAGGQSDLPAKYAPFLVWKDEKPANAPAPKLEDVWDVAKFPKLTGKLVKYIGHGNTYVPPKEGDSFVLDFPTAHKLTRLEFGAQKPTAAYLSLYGPLELVSVNTFTTGAYACSRFTSRTRDHAIHIDVIGAPGRGDPRFVQLFITCESYGRVSAAVIVEGLVDGEFPAPKQNPPKPPAVKEAPEIEWEGILYLNDRKGYPDGLTGRNPVVQAKPEEALTPYQLRVQVPGARSEWVDVVLDTDTLRTDAKANLGKRVTIRGQLRTTLVVPDHPEVRIEKGGTWLPVGTGLPRPRPVLFGVRVKPRPFEKPWSGEPITKVAWVEGGQLATLKRLPSASEVTALRIEPGLNPLKSPLTVAGFPALLASMKPVRSDSDLKDGHHAPSFRVEFETADGPFQLGTYLGNFGLLRTPDGGIGWVTFDLPVGGKL